MDTSIRPLADVEREAYLRALTELNGDTAAVAKALGVSRNTVYAKMIRHGIRIKRTAVAEIEIIDERQGQ